MNDLSRTRFLRRRQAYIDKNNYRMFYSNLLLIDIEILNNYGLRSFC